MSPDPARATASNKRPKDGDTPDQRFRPTHRLLDANAFSRVFKKAQRSRDKFFTVLYRTNGGDNARLGLAIAKKHCRLATGRNRIKRIIRESFRRHAEELAGLDVVVMNTPATGEAGNASLFESLDRHWQRCRGQREESGRG